MVNLKNGVMVTMVLCILILLFVVFKKKPEVVDHSGTIELLQEQNRMLEAQNLDLKKKQQIQSALDSVLIEKLEQKILKDHKTIQQLKTVRDEKIIHIDTAGNDELRNLLRSE